MEPKNKISRDLQRQGGNDKIVEYTASGETVRLSPNIIRNYLVTGGGNVSDQEVVMFLNMCRFQHLNPFLKEAHLIKYGNAAATMVVGKDAMTKRAQRNPKYEGYEAGVIVQAPEKEDLVYRTGSLVLAGETLVGGWAKVHVKGYVVPIEAAVGFDEYVGTKSDGTINAQWSKKPATMIRKVALVQALRDAFPDELGALYDSSEMGLDIVDDGSMAAPIEVPDAAPAQAQAPAPERTTIIDDQPQLTAEDLPGGF